MFRAASFLACLAAAAAWLISATSLAGDIYVYQASNGSRLITDHPRMEAGYRLVKVYSESRLWQQTGTRQRAAIKPLPSSYDALIESTARQLSLDPMLIKSVMHAESAFDPKAVSHKGASGLMQLMPATAERYGVSRIFDPRQNVMGGARYLSYLLERFDGDLELALAGYNAGENAVDRSGGVPPYAETRNYIRKVMRLYRLYRNEGCLRPVDDGNTFTGTIISCSASLRGPASGATLSSVSMEPSGGGTTRDTALLSADDSQGQWRLD
jgi:soluble lytic murein transglycosylase-like protein